VGAGGTVFDGAGVSVGALLPLEHAAVRSARETNAATVRRVTQRS
jgi:hypothetical protein